MALVENIAYDEMRVALGWAMMMSGGTAPPAAISPTPPKPPVAPVAKAAAKAAPAKAVSHGFKRGAGGGWLCGFNEVRKDATQRSWGGCVRCS
jgi:hypothetical protein